MRPKLLKTLLSLFFLLLFISGKASSYHTLLHDYDSNVSQCKVCDIVLTTQFSPTDISSEISVPIEIQKEIENKNSPVFLDQFHCSTYYSILYSRPPPSLN